ncbi:MAG: LLM class F420-dependent oxidoreductase [Actinobacteria bacterium]|nr:LLM class F420-dependent oxidoreductase [Actinomycetota bacterium]
MTVPQRHGLTVPFEGVPLHEHKAWFEELEQLGYTDLWSAEAGACDAFTPLALAAAWAPKLRLGTAIVPAYTRGAATLAQTVAAMCQAAPGRFALGIGTSSDVIVERWNGIPFEKPYQRVRDTIRFLRAALAGEKVTAEYETFAVNGFRLGAAVEEMPPILVAALRPGMLKLAGREGDGAIINWLSADDVKTVVPHVGEGKEIVARIFVFATTDRDLVQYVGRRSIAAYLNVPVYAQFHEWLGRGAALAPMWDAWKAGDRAAATEAIPEELIDQLIVHGTVDEIREHLARFVANGVTTPAPAIMGSGEEVREVMRALAPNAG